MGLATASKIIFLLIWPVIFLLIIYFSDKEKFKIKLKKMFGKD
jgi:hypothetical protein